MSARRSADDVGRAGEGVVSAVDRRPDDVPPTAGIGVARGQHEVVLVVAAAAEGLLPDGRARDVGCELVDHLRGGLMLRNDVAGHAGWAGRTGCTLQLG